jgi:hypothetical protein
MSVNNLTDEEIMHIGGLVEVLVKRFRAFGHLRELFLKLQEDTARNL